MAEPIRPALPPGMVSVRRTFVEPIATAEAFATVILALVEEACAALKRCCAGARTLDLVLERVDGSAQVRASAPPKQHVTPAPDAPLRLPHCNGGNGRSQLCSMVAYECL